MKPAFKAELRKILTVRSTYVVGLAIFALPVALISFWIYGYKDMQHAAQSGAALISTLFAAIGVVGVLLSFIAILSVGHEYRYNTILYSLTAASRRRKVFLAKWLAILTVSFVVAVLAMALSVAGFYIGQQLAHIQTVSQTMPGINFGWRALAAVLLGSSLAFIIAMLLRSLVGAIALFLLLPSTIESLLTLILKDNVRYLPYTSLGNLTTEGTKIPYTSSLLTVVAYVLVFGGIAYVLFLRRDAS